MIDYNKRLVEVDEILNYLSEEDLLKIPEDIKRLIKENKDKEYVWNYDETKPLEEQNLDRDTIAILSYLNMEYLLDEEQKKLMQQIYESNESKSEEQETKQYNVDNLFKNRKYVEDNNTESNTQEEMAIVEIKKESFLKIIINKIKSIFTK